MEQQSLRRVVSRAYRGVTVLVVVLLAVMGGLLGVRIGHYDVRIRQTDQATRAVREAHGGMLDQETGVRGYLLGDAADADVFLEPYVAGRSAFSAGLAVARTAVHGDPVLEPLLRTAAERAARWQDTWAEPIVRDRSAAAPGDVDLRGKAMFDDYRGAAQALVEALKDRTDGLAGQERAVSALGGGLAVLVAAAVLVGVRRQHRRLICALVDPIGELAATVHRIRDGDLHLAAGLAAENRGGGPVELAGLATDVHDMAAALLGRDAELHRSREMLLQAQRLAGIGSWELLVETRTLTWSEEMYRIKGVAAGTSVTPELMLSMIHPDDREAIREAVRDVAAHGGVRRFDHRAVRPDGDVRYIAGRVEGELGRDGRPYRVTATSQDVTARREADQALAESEARYRLLAQNSSDVIVRHRPDGTVLYVSPASEALLGIDPADLVGRRLAAIVHPDDHAGLAASVAEMRDGADRSILAVRAGHADGRWIWTESASTAIRTPDGALEEIHTAVRDAGERMRTQEELRRQAIVFEHISDSVLLTDADGVVLDCNAAAVQLTGYAREELLGRLPGEQHDREHAHAAAAAVAAHVTAHGGRRADIDFVRADGTRRVLEIVTVAIRDRADAMIGMIHVARDVTEQRELAAERERAAEAMKDARDAALAATEAKSAFLATMSHEIRTPMNAVIGMTGLLLDTGLDPQQREFVETVRTSGDALLATINDILDFSKIEAGELELERAPFAPRDCVESALDLVAAGAAAKGLELVYHVDPACPARVLGDVTRLRQVLTNLLSNAVKFTERGDVLVTVSPGDGGVLRVAVADTGIGIPADRMDRLFTSFSQVDASTTRVYGGTGLGLAISRALVEAMGGELSLTSEVGRGSTFTFTAALDTTGEMPPDTGPGADLPGRSVLVVDDNATTRRILRLQLESWGMTCTDVGTPAEGLAHVRDGRFDLALLDMTMPAMNGDELAAALRLLPGGRDLPLVLLTGLGGVACRGDFAAYLTKPVKTSALRDAVARALHPDHEAGGGHATPVDNAPGPALRVLLAEDNVVNQKVGLLMLSRLGHRVDIVGTGREALEAVLRQPYDVVLMDVHMPEMDGIEATRRIRTEVSADRQPHIVAVTASALISDRDACAAAGMDDYLPKPVRADDLAAVLARLGGVPVAPVPPAAAVDPAALDGLLGQLGDAAPATRLAVLDSYLGQGADWVAELVSAARDGDTGTVARIAHTLQSSSRIVGAGTLADLLRDAEASARSGDTAAVRADAIASEYQRVAAELTALRAEQEKA